MARCSLTGKSSMKACNISKSNIHLRRWQRANIHTKRIYDETLGRFVSVQISTKALRTVNKIGLSAYMKKQNLTLKDLK